MSIVLWYEQLVRRFLLYHGRYGCDLCSYILNTDEVTLMKYCSGVARGTFQLHCNSLAFAAFAIIFNKLVLF